jgi:peroxin-6
MARHAMDYGLHLSVLLKGARGIGKFTVATWVAQRLGMHLLEVNIFTLSRVFR